MISRRSLNRAFATLSRTLALSHNRPLQAGEQESSPVNVTEKSDPIRPPPPIESASTLK